MKKEFMFRAVTIHNFTLPGTGSNLQKTWSNDGTSQGISLIPGEKEGFFILPPLSSGIPECRWHRFQMNADIPENSYIRLQYYMAETPSAGIKNLTDLEYIKQNNKLREITFQKYRDALVDPAGGEDAIKGKYIYIIISFLIKNIELHSPLFYSLKVHYQRLSYLRYLPLFLQDNKLRKDFLERFLAIFESSFYESEETILNSSCYIDPMAAPYTFIPWLAKWFSLDLYELLQEQNREFVLKAYQFYKKKGTLAGLTEIISFLTGKKCRVKEYYNNIFRVYGMEHRMRKSVHIEDEKINYGYYRGPSITVNSDRETNRNLLGKIGTYHDELHYTIDTSTNSRYAREAVGIFIFVDQEDLGFYINEEEILKVIRSFIPIFVRIVEFRIVYEEKDEIYPLNRIFDSYSSFLADKTLEQGGRITGEYYDNQGWSRFYSNDQDCVTNNPVFRTLNIETEKWHEA